MSTNFNNPHNVTLAMIQGSRSAAKKITYSPTKLKDEEYLARRRQLPNTARDNRERFAVVVVLLTLIAAFAAMIIAAYSSNINGSKRPPAASKEIGQYQTSQFSPEAKLRDSQDIAVLQKRYMNSPTDADRKLVIQELHRRLATIPYGTLPEDQQKFVALFY